MTEAPSPLSTPSPDALTALFEADPLTLTDPQLMNMIAELRRRRNDFLSSEAAKALAPKKTRTKVDPSPDASLAKPVADISLDDL